MAYAYKPPMMARPIQGLRTRMMAHPMKTDRRFSISGRFRVALIVAVLALSTLAVDIPMAQGHSGSATQRSEAARIVAAARSHIGARFRMGSEGPRYFDCSGLIYRVYQQSGLLSRIGGARRTAAAYYRWFKQRGKASRTNPKVGDLVIWTKHGKISHSGIYIGNGQVISALINPWGVKRTSLYGVRSKFLAFLHVNISR